MTVFFFVVGLEIKRELIAGELNDVRKATLPVIAAMGGMALPALIYIALNAGGPGARGWGIPMATDIAFSIGVLVLLGDRVPLGLRVFVLSLAIVDDVGAIVVIALVYSSEFHAAWLLTAVLLLAGIVALQRVGLTWAPVFAVIAAFVWLATYGSGVHATIAGVALAMVTPARSIEGKGSTADRLEQLLHPWTSLLVVPLFALANAGVSLDGQSLRAATGSSVALGVAVGLVVGKMAGIALSSKVAIEAGFGSLPADVTGRSLLGGAAVAGIGFTVSLFITGLAFDDPELIASAKIGILVGSLISGLLGAALLWRREGVSSAP
jgi:NhaA family Na+:H+ antiporter